MSSEEEELAAVRAERASKLGIPLPQRKVFKTSFCSFLEASVHGFRNEVNQNRKSLRSTLFVG